MAKVDTWQEKRNGTKGWCNQNVLNAFPKGYFSYRKY